ncbi:MAG: hypothetical protein GXO09_05770 [Crenarchaeota archaeon]|nr:hypothetical protein [Thermoproteota archaeon]
MSESDASSGQGECIVRLDDGSYRIVVSAEKPRVKGKALLVAELPASLVASREHACTAAAEMLANARRGRRVAKNPYLNLVAFLLGVRSITRIVELIERLRDEEKIYLVVAEERAHVEGVREPRYRPDKYLEALRSIGVKVPENLSGQAAARYATTRTAAFSINLKL